MYSLQTGLLFTFLTVATCLDVAPPYPVLRIKFEVNPAHTNQLLAQIIDTEAYAKTEPNVTASQLAVNTNLQELSLAQCKQIAEKSKLNFTRINLDKIKEISKTLKINTSQQYNLFMNLLSEPRKQLSEAIKVLNASEVEIMYYLIANPLGDETFFDHFKHSNFSQETWSRLMVITGITDEVVFQFVKEMTLVHLGNVSLLNFARLLKNVTGEVSNFDVGYTQGQVGLLKAAFDVLEVYPEDSFGRMLQRYNASIVHPLMLTTRVKTGYYLSSKAVHQDVLRMKEEYAKPFLVDYNGRYEVANMTLNGSLVHFQTNDKQVFVAPHREVTQYASCFYALNDQQTEIVSASEDKTKLIVGKSLRVSYIPGAPLFCDQQLVGVAIGDTASTIVFAKIQSKIQTVVATSANNDSSALKPSNIPIAVNSNDQKPTLATGPSKDFLMHVTFNLITEKIPNLIAYILFQDHTITEDIGLPSTKDFIDAFKLNSLTYEQLQGMLKDVGKGGIPFKLIDTLQSANVSLIQTYHKFMFFLSSVQEKNMLAALNISQSELHRQMLYFTDDQMFVKFISTGNFNKTNIEKALKAAGLTETEVFNFVKPIFLEKIASLDAYKILQFFHSNGGYKAVQFVIRMLNVRAENFKTASFNKMLTKFERRIHNASALASAESRSHLVTTNNIYDHWSDNATREFVVLQVENVNTGNTYNISRVVPYYSGYSNLTLTTPLPNDAATIQVSTGMMPKLCYMVTDDNAFGPKQVTTVHGGFQMATDAAINDKTYKLGAALVCDDLLYGVAISATSKKIQFAGFRNAQVIDPSHPGHPGHPGQSFGNRLEFNYSVAFLSSIVACFIALMY